MKQINGLFLVDDDNIFNHIHQNAIERVGFAKNIKIFEDPIIALDNLKRISESDPDNFPEIIFLDINMLMMDAWEFMEELNSFPEHVLEKCKVIIVRQQVKIYMLSSSVDPHDKEKAQNPLVSGYITKPLSQLKLLTIFPEYIKPEIALIKDTIK